MEPMTDTQTFRSTHESVAALIDACRNTQFVFEMSAGTINDRLLRAELLQYSGQRREFIAELVDAARRIQDGVIDPGNIREPLQRSFRAIKKPADQGDVDTILKECQAADLAAMEVYRSKLSASLPHGLQSMIITQLAAMSRVRERIERLRINARPDRN